MPNVGIGTTNPSHRLHIQGPGTANHVVRSEITKTDTTYLEAMRSYVLNTPSADYAARSTAGSFANLVSSANHQTASYASAIDATIGSYAAGNKLDFRGVNISGGNSTGTVTDYRGLYSIVRNSSGTITNAYGGYFTTEVDSGTVTNAYGVYTGPIAGTNKFSFYASDVNAPSYFAGNVGIGTTTPQTALDVNGVVKVAKYAAQPFACEASKDGSLALTSTYRHCVCNGGSSTWVYTSDGTTACSW